MSTTAGATEKSSDLGTSETEHVNNANDHEKPQRRGCVAFLKRWWWLILIILVIIALVVLLPVFLVAIPKVIQKTVDNTELSVQGIQLTQTEANSVYTQLNSTITSASSFTATIDAFNASLYLEDKLPHVVFAYIQMPQTVSKHVTAVNISQVIPIYNSQAYADYASWYLLNESFRMTVSGETNVHIKGLRSTKVNFQKTVNLTGLNGFKGLNVTSSSVSLSADSQGDNFHGFVNVPNPSLLTVDIGNATFKNILNGTEIGLMYIDNMVLYPGNNNLSVRANISQSPILSAVTSEPYCESGVIPLQVQGVSVINNGQELTYFEQGLRSNIETVDVDVGADLSALFGSKIGCTQAANSSSTTTSASTSSTGT